MTISNATKKFYADNIANLFEQENIEFAVMSHAKEITAKAKAFRKYLNVFERSDFDTHISILVLNALTDHNKNQIDYRKVDSSYLRNLFGKNFDSAFGYEKEILKTLLGWEDSYAYIILTNALLEYNRTAV